MREKGIQGKWRPGLIWIILNTLGWGAFILIALVIGLLAWQVIQNSTSGHEFLSDQLVNVLVSSVPGGLCWGAILGGLQKSFLMRHLNFHGKNWTFATIIGLMLYIAFQVSHQYLLIFVESPITYPFDSVIKTSLMIDFLDVAFYFIPPLVLGIAQWSVLRLYFKWSGWWIAAVTLGVGCAGWTISEIVRMSFANGYNSFAAFSIAVYPMEGLAYGIATWFVLVFFANHLAITNSGDSE